MRLRAVGYVVLLGVLVVVGVLCAAFIGIPAA